MPRTHDTTGRSVHTKANRVERASFTACSIGRHASLLFFLLLQNDNDGSQRGKQHQDPGPNACCCCSGTDLPKTDDGVAKVHPNLLRAVPSCMAPGQSRQGIEHRPVHVLILLGSAVRRHLLSTRRQRGHGARSARPSASGGGQYSHDRTHQSHHLVRHRKNHRATRATHRRLFSRALLRVQTRG